MTKEFIIYGKVNYCNFFSVPSHSTNKATYMYGAGGIVLGHTEDRCRNSVEYTRHYVHKTLDKRNTVEVGNFVNFPNSHLG